jgi:predicted Zn-dependent protease
VNGLPAATAEAAAGNWVFRIGAVRVGGSMYRLIFADRKNRSGIDRAMRDTLGSFHKLSASEAARLRPLRLDVVAVRRGDSVAGLAGRMQGTERRVELFRLINGLGPSDEVVAGQSVKLVAD